MSPRDLRTGRALRHRGQRRSFWWRGRLSPRWGRATLQVPQQTSGFLMPKALPTSPFFTPCRYLSHTELAPLRAPLIPMEHCTTRFFETCDLDNDKYIALDEWAGCFGIKESECPSRGAAVLRLPPLSSAICMSVLCPPLLSA